MRISVNGYFFFPRTIDDFFLACRCLFVLTFKQDVCRIVMQLVEWHIELMGNVQGKTRQNRMALFEERIQRTSQPIVIDFIERHTPQDVSAGIPCPLVDSAQCRRTRKPRCHEQAQRGPKVEVGLGICRHVLVDDRYDLHLFYQRKDDRQRAKAASFRVRLISVPSKRHVRTMAKFDLERNAPFRYI